ncbi:MAG: hypothetical protein V2B19_13780 [Pseudomonadota bacterium]
MELDDTLVKAELDDIMARIDGIMKKVEKYEGNSKEKPVEPNEESASPFREAHFG